MATIKTRKRVDLTAVDRRLEQIDRKPGLVSRHTIATGEWEIEASDPGVSADELQRIVDALPEHPDPEVERVAREKRRADRRPEIQRLVGLASWKAADTEAALRLLLAAELDRS